MTHFPTTVACLALVAVTAAAQDIAPRDSERDPILSALTDGFTLDDDIPSVTVDISATDSSHLQDELEEFPRFFTGSPAEEDLMEEEIAPAVPEPKGVTISVEPGRDGHAAIKASSVKLLAPFPAKPLFQAPDGWRLEHPEDVPTFVREVPLSNGTRISLTIRPHLLVPDADGDQVVAVNEPGYDPDLRYAQTGTMGAVLSSSIERMDEDSRQMGTALDRLRQLLSSLPAAEEPPKAEPSPNKKQR